MAGSELFLDYLNGPDVAALALTDECSVAGVVRAHAAAKAASLKFLGHWLGDVHQPLHVSFEDDRGGNKVEVTGDCRGNLHSAWDSCMVMEAVGGDVQNAAYSLLASVTQEQIRTWTQSGPREWANESFKVTESVTTKYCEMHSNSCEQPSGNVRIDQAYIDANVPVVKEQLQKAGIRLAQLLDRALGD